MAAEGIRIWCYVGIPVVCCLNTNKRCAGLGYRQADLFFVLEAITDSFLFAAIPEELAKLFMLWLLQRKNPFFDEHFDGIVYAVCIGLGFAALENVFYLLGGIEDWSWIGTGIMRAFISVPAHYFFAILMGYYYSVYHFGIDRSIKAKTMILAAPVIAHGIFDAILFSMQVNESLSGIIMILFIVFFTKPKNRAKEKVTLLIETRLS